MLRRRKCFLGLRRIFVPVSTATPLPPLQHWRVVPQQLLFCKLVLTILARHCPFVCSPPFPSPPPGWGFFFPRPRFPSPFASLLPLRALLPPLQFFSSVLLHPWSSSVPRIPGTPTPTGEPPHTEKKAAEETAERGEEGQRWEFLNRCTALLSTITQQSPYTVGQSGASATITPTITPTITLEQGGACRVIAEARLLKSFPCKDLFETELPTITRQTPPCSRVIVGVIVGVIVADAPD